MLGYIVKQVCETGVSAFYNRNEKSNFGEPRLQQKTFKTLNKN